MVIRECPSDFLRGLQPSLAISVTNDARHEFKILFTNTEIRGSTFLSGMAGLWPLASRAGF